MDIISSADSQLFEPFFTMLPSEAPLLKRLILRGPDMLPTSSLEFISQCTNLESLELSDVVGIKDWGLLQSIGTLPRLKELIVITHDLKYKSDIDNMDASGFRSLQNLTVTAPFLLIRDLIRCIGSNIKSVKLTPIMNFGLRFLPSEAEPIPLTETPEPRPVPVSGWGTVSKTPFAWSGTSFDCPEPGPISLFGAPDPPPVSASGWGMFSCPEPLVNQIESRPISPPILPCVCKRKKGKKPCKFCVNNSGIPTPEPFREDIHGRIAYPAPMAVEPVRGVSIQEQVVPPVVEDLDANGCLALLQEIFNVATLRWDNSLESLTISLQDTFEPTLIPHASQTLELPSDLILSWSQFCNLQTLDISFWKLPSLNDVLVQFSGSWPQLQSLRFPLEPYGSPVNLGSLRTLATHCPNLRVIQAPVDASFDEIIPFDSSAGYALKHKLSILSVGSTATPQQVLTIGRYINILFPHLDMLETHKGHNEEHWRQISDVVRLCQKVREDDNNRI